MIYFIIDVTPTTCTTNKRKRRQRSRRSIASSSDDAILVPVNDEAPYFYNPSQVNITELTTFPTASGVTEAQAVDKCTKAVTESIFGKACMTVYPDMKTSDIVDECVLDFKVSSLI